MCWSWTAPNHFWLFSLLLLLIKEVLFIKAKYVQGVLDTKSDWQFIARFCFASEFGALRYQITYPHVSGYSAGFLSGTVLLFLLHLNALPKSEFLVDMDYAVQNLLLYYDSASQWPSVYKTRKTCEEKEAVLNREHYQIVNLSTWTQDDFSFPQCVDALRGDQKWFICDRTIRFSSIRERWWFIAISNCNTSKGLYMEYKLWMTNSNPNDFWFYHFSVDEFYILPTDIGFLLLAVFTFATGCAIALILRSRQMLHVTYKLFLCSQACECLSLLLLCLAYGDYATNGVGLPLIKLLGELMAASSTLIFIFMLVLIGKGYTITRGRLSKRGSLKLSLFMALYTLTYATLFIYQAKFFDPGEVTYIYESPAGYGLLALRIIGCIWFCYAIYFTLSHYPEKRCFYTVFAIFYSLWFLTGPCIILIANFFLGKWMREKIVNGAEKAINFAGLSTFLIITRPSAANKTFPYHVRTTQITAMEARPDDEATSLPHNTYEMNSQTYDIFTVQRARETYNAKRRDPFVRTKSGNKETANGASSSYMNGNDVISPLDGNR